MIERFSRICAALIGIGLPWCATGHSHAAEWPSQVIAKYRVSFAGFNIGSFNFRSDVSSKGYSLAGEAKVSAVFGAFKWRGFTRSEGRTRKGRPLPANYSFDYQSNRKRGSVRMAFRKGQIIKNEVVPYKPYSNKHVPLRSDHLRGVYDPITAVMALTSSAKGHPCRRRIPIFDGKQRFDLVLKPAGRVQIQESRPSGQPGLGYVCKVRYVPLGGYKNNSQTKYMAKNPGLRVVLRAVPSANVFIPYEVRVPTIAGEAVLTSRKVEIVTARRQRIALVH